MIKFFLLDQLRLWRLLLIFFPLVLYGCLPVVYTYWGPTAQGGKLYYSAADTGSIAIAPSNTIEFSYDGVQIQISGNGNEVGITLRISKQHYMSFLSDEVEIHEKLTSELTKIQFEVTSIDVTTLKRVHFNPCDKLTENFYAIDIIFTGPERRQYTIKLPSIKIKNRIYELPEIEFTKKKGLGLFGF